VNNSKSRFDEVERGVVGFDEVTDDMREFGSLSLLHEEPGGSQEI
jgi:hypothetical protein